MLGAPPQRRRTTDEAEKPFWISYADLMTSLMVLFLVVMLASLAALYQSVKSAAEINQKNEEQAEELQQLKAQEAEFREIRTRIEERIADVAERQNLSLREGSIIEFGSRAQFEQGSDSLNATQMAAIRTLAPELINEANSDIGRQVISRIIVEGFASPEGTYLSNLDLSSRRSQRVMCTLLDPPLPQADDVRALFATAGASSTSLKRNHDASRRIEMRIEFYPELRKPGTKRQGTTGPIGSCALGD